MPSIIGPNPIKNRTNDLDNKHPALGQKRNEALNEHNGQPDGRKSNPS